MKRAEPEIVTPARLKEWPLADAGVDKHSRGTVLVLGGSATTPGAVLLAGEASLRAGAGKLMLATVRSVATALAVAVPEARVFRLDEDIDGSIDPSAAPAILEAADDVDALLIGPGFADTDAAVALLSATLPRVSRPVVLDALGTAYVTARPEGLAHLAGRAIVTANPTELAAMLHRDEEEITQDAGRAALDLAERTGAVVLAGSATKHVAAPDGRTWIVEGGGPGLGVSGSGDVQAGIAAGLLGRGEEPAKAAVWAAFLHARAGEHLAGSVARLGYLARELPPVLPGVIAEVS